MLPAARMAPQQEIKQGRLFITLTNRTGVRLPDAKIWTAAMGRAVKAHAKNRRTCLSLVAVVDKEMAQLNRRWHKVRGTTDVLSFPEHSRDLETGRFNLGEVIVCRDRAVAEGRARQIPTRQELALYALHGLLHLLGFSDNTAAQREKMEAQQTRLLDFL